MRMTALPPLASHAATESRAPSFALGATASSRSMMISCAPLASAFSMRSGRSPGTNRKVRGMRALFEDDIVGGRELAEALEATDRVVVLLGGQAAAAVFDHDDLVVAVVAFTHGCLHDGIGRDAGAVDTLHAVGA